MCQIQLIKEYQAMELVNNMEFLEVRIVISLRAKHVSL